MTGVMTMVQMRARRWAIGAVTLMLTGVLVAAQTQTPDRSKPPQNGPAPELRLPPIQKRQLSNGLPVWIVEMHKVPVAQVNLLIKSGSADDPPRRFGLSSMTAAMLEQGAGSRTALQIADAIDFLGADPETPAVEWPARVDRRDAQGAGRAGQPADQERER